MKKLSLFLIILLGSTILTFGQQVDSKTSKVVFYRTKKLKMSSAKFIVGSPKPDTVFIKLNNSAYHELFIKDFREWKFVGGFYSLSANEKMKIEPGKTYYIHCYVKAAFPVDKGLFKIVDEYTALKDMKKLRKQ